MVANVRELENAVERAVILSDSGGKIEAELPGLIEKRSKTTRESVQKKNNDNLDRIESLEEIEKIHIASVLDKCDGNRTHAAEKLGVNVRTLRNKIKQFNLG